MRSARVDNPPGRGQIVEKSVYAVVPCRIPCGLSEEEIPPAVLFFEDHRNVRAVARKDYAGCRRFGISGDE